MGAGLGELEADEGMAVSFGSDGVLSAVWGRAVKDVRLRGWVSELGVAVRPNELLGRPNELLGRPTELPGEWRPGPGAGDDDNDPALNGWNDTEVRLWNCKTSPDRREDFDP
jgi:hypothetical protein